MCSTGSFHEPRSFLHKAQKFSRPDTNVAETLNECILSVKKMGSVGVIAAYTGYTNGFNIGALMEYVYSLYSHCAIIEYILMFDLGYFLMH